MEALDAGIRLRDYPKGSMLLCRIAVTHMKDAEDAMKLLCCHDVVQRRDYGSEYYQGSVHTMMRKLLNSSAAYSRERTQPFAKVEVPVLNQLNEFLKMSAKNRGCSITHVAGHVTSLSEFRALYEIKMGKGTFFADPGIFKLFNMRLSPNRVQICASCKKEAKRWGGPCCAEYNHQTRGKKFVLFDTMIVSVAPEAPVFTEATTP